MIFTAVVDFETHYNSLHRFNCGQCKRNLPSAHLLDLHLEETHDSYFALLCKKKPSFRCFLEECSERFMTAAERQEHSIKQHKLPHSFKFVTKQKKEPVEKMDEDQPGPSVVKGKKTTSGIKHIKPITFGHNVPKSFDTSYAKALTKHEKKSKKGPAKPLEDNLMMVDLLESLPN